MRNVCWTGLGRRRALRPEHGRRSYWLAGQGREFGAGPPQLEKARARAGEQGAGGGWWVGGMGGFGGNWGSGGAEG